MLIDCSTPSWGHAASIVDTGTVVVQSWSGLHAPGTQTASPASGTAGNAPGLVYPPVDAEYWVDATAPPGNSMT